MVTWKLVNAQLCVLDDAMDYDACIWQNTILPSIANSSCLVGSNHHRFFSG